MELIVQNVLQKMGIVGKPDWTALTLLLTTILTLCGKVNFMNLSRYSGRNEKTFRRQFAKPLNVSAFNQAFVEIEIPEAHPVLGLLDASFNAKSRKKTFGLDHFYNGSHGRSERGLEISLLAVVDTVTEQAYAFHAQQTYQKNLNPLLTRTDYYLIHLEENRPYLPQRLKYLAMDSAYANGPFINGVKALQLDVISKLRQDANLRYLYEGEQKARGARRKYDGKVDFTDFSRFTWVKQVEAGVDLYTLLVWHQTLKRTIRLACLVDRRNCAKLGYVLLFSTDVSQSAEEILRFYKLRFQIEFIFRDAKQFTGLSDCQARNEKALDFHFNASLMALNLAKREARLQHTGTKDFIFSMNNVKRGALNDHLLNRFISKLDLDPTLIKSHPNFQSLREYGLITI
jgi:Transposase DDE domain